MFERFTDGARDVIALAHQEAQRRNHVQIGTEHILLAILQKDSGASAMVLQNLGVNLAGLSNEIEKLTRSDPKAVSTGKPRQTVGAKKAIEYAIEEARVFHHASVDTVHILLGVLRDREGVAAQVLRSVGVRLEEVRSEILKLPSVGNEQPPIERRELHGQCSHASGQTARAASYKDLPAWQKADELARQAYAVTAQLPEERIPGVASRVREIALSIPPQIAEAHDRRIADETRWFLDVALGALRELRYLLDLAESLDALKGKDLRRLADLADEVDRRLRELHASLAHRQRSPSLMASRTICE